MTEIFGAMISSLEKYSSKCKYCISNTQNRSINLLTLVVRGISMKHGREEGVLTSSDIFFFVTIYVIMRGLHFKNIVKTSNLMESLGRPCKQSISLNI